MLPSTHLYCDLQVSLPHHVFVKIRTVHYLSSQSSYVGKARQTVVSSFETDFLWNQTSSHLHSPKKFVSVLWCRSALWRLVANTSLHLALAIRPMHQWLLILTQTVLKVAFSLQNIQIHYQTCVTMWTWMKHFSAGSRIAQWRVLNAAATMVFPWSGDVACGGSVNFKL